MDESDKKGLSTKVASAKVNRASADVSDQFGSEDAPAAEEEKADEPADGAASSSSAVAASSSSSPVTTPKRKAPCASPSTVEGARKKKPVKKD